MDGWPSFFPSTINLRHSTLSDGLACVFGLIGKARKVRPSSNRWRGINRRHRYDSCCNSRNVRVAGRPGQQPSRPHAWFAATIAPECQRLPAFPNGCARRGFSDRQAPRGQCLRPQKRHRGQKSRVRRKPFGESRKLRARVATVQGPGPPQLTIRRTGSRRSGVEFELGHCGG